MDELQVRDVTSPVLLRFPDILDNRIEKISKCFQQAADEYGYTAKNFIIYPIKVNQMRQVVEEIVSHGKKFNIGLEAGSKPELHAVLAINTDENSLIICNGYKDENYVELALLAQKMGRRIFLVVEKLNELRLIADISKRLKIRPNIGIRIKLASSGSGKWEESGGDGSKFGLNSSELLEALDFLEKAKMTDCLKLIHFHIGSQITKIRRIKNALKEASQFYVQLQNMGFHVEFVDIGGGLGVDYDGTRSSSSESSMNYSIQEYVNDSVSALVDACAKNNLPQPNIITESGRSLTAHHSVLVFEVLETTSLPIWDEKEELGENPHELVDELYKIWDNMNQPWLLESWHDALQIRGRSARPVRVGATRLTYPCPDRATILVCGSRSERNRLRHEACSRRTSENLQTSARQVFLQLLSVPVVTRFMVDRPTFPHHAHQSARRASRPHSDHTRHYLRFRRKNQ